MSLVINGFRGYFLSTNLFFFITTSSFIIVIGVIKFYVQVMVFLQAWSTFTWWMMYPWMQKL